MFCETCWVIESSRAEAQAASNSQSSCSFQCWPAFSALAPASGRRFTARIRKESVQAEQDETAICRGPEQSLAVRGQQRLNEQRITEQRQERAGVRKRVEAVGTQALAAEGVPSLQKRAGGRKQEEGKAHGRGERTQNPPSGLFAAARLPKSAGQDGQEQQARPKKQGMSTRRNTRRWRAGSRYGRRHCRGDKSVGRTPG